MLPILAWEEISLHSVVNIKITEFPTRSKVYHKAFRLWSVVFCEAEAPLFVWRYKRGPHAVDQMHIFSEEGGVDSSTNRKNGYVGSSVHYQTG